VFVRDSGILHALLEVGKLDALLGHPIAGPSWEGMVIEQLVSVAPPGTEAHFYRSSGGAEVDLVLSIPARGIWAIEIKRSLNPRPGGGSITQSKTLSRTDPISPIRGRTGTLLRTASKRSPYGSWPS
jgi:predicted AAA+ superfamily ATPase